MEEETNHELIHRETAAIRELLAAKFDGVYGILDKMGEAIDRVTRTVEKQGEQQVQLAILTTSVSHMGEAFAHHRDKVTDEIADLTERVADLETSKATTDLKLGGAKIVAGGAAGAIVGFITSNFDVVAKFFGG